jgi:hypothetical protein
MKVESYRDSPIRECVRAILGSVSDLDESVITSLQAKGISSMSTISYLALQLSYIGLSVLSFEKVSWLDRIGISLLALTSVDFKDEVTNDSLKVIIASLDKLDITQSRFKYGLGYRFLKMVVTMVLHHSFVDASVISRMLLQQASVSVR